MELACFTLGYLCSCILEGCRPKEALPESFAGKRSCANVVTTNASMYLCQQLLSIFPGNTLQFHSVESSSVQCVVNELVHTRLSGYSFRFFLLFGKFSCLEETDDLLRPCWSLWLDNKDERHICCCGNIRFYGENLRFSRSLTFPGKLAGAKLVGSVCFNGTNPGVCRSKLLPSTLGIDLGDLLGGGFGKLCRKIVTRNQLPLLALSS